MAAVSALSLQSWVAEAAQAIAASTRQQPCYFSLHSTQGLVEVLKRPGRFFIEAGDYYNLQSSLDFLLQEAPDFGLCMRSQYTYSSDIAHIITHALDNRYGLNKAKNMHILTCLQEALANAVIHGNLCIECERNTLEGFERYYQEINTRIAIPEFANLRVFLRAWERQGSFRICITHEGDGILHNSVIQESHPEFERRPGRGLYIIQSLAEWVMTDVTRKSLDITFTY